LLYAYKNKRERDSGVAREYYETPLYDGHVTIWP